MTKEEILAKYQDWNDDYIQEYSEKDILQAMEEYALEYHNERLREEIEKFVLWNEGDCRPEYNTKIVNRYMRNYEI
jgi:hypothetical protein